MNDGGGKETEKDPSSSYLSQHQQHNTRKSYGKEDFTRAIAKISVAQICENEGFHGFQQSALETLADIGVRYIRELGKASNLYACLAGRSECNVFDIIQGLEDLESVHWFPGASDVHHSIGKSGVIKEIGQYVSLVEEMPFVFDIPRFPVCKDRKLLPSFSEIGDVPPGEHIPVWLPALPGVEKRVCSPDNGVGMDKEVEMAKNVQQQRQQQQQEILGGNHGIEGDLNPFLAPPLRYGEKEVAFVEPPLRFFDGRYGNEMGTLGPVCENEGGENEMHEVEERSKVNARLDRRPTVRLKFNNMRKPLCSSKNVVRQKIGDEKLAKFFGMDEEIDEKKSSAEENLKESTATQQLNSTEL